MRILHVLSTLSPKSGGPQAAIFPMLKALTNHGVEVEIASTNSDGPGLTLTRDQLPKSTFSVQLCATDDALSTWIQDRSREMDVIHVHGLWNKASSAAMNAARKFHKPYVIRTCGMLAPYSWNRRWWKKRPYWWLVDRVNVRNAGAIHVTSPGERDEVAAWQLPAPIHEIPLGLDDQAFDTPILSDDLRKRCGSIAGDKPIILTLGRLHPVKGITDLLLPAFAKLKSSAFLAIVGGPDATVPNYPNEIRKTIETLGLVDRVGLLGAISPRDKWALYDGATIYVQPSHTENFGLSVAEAMSRACPVIVTEGVQSKSVVETAGGGWVVPFQIDRLAMQIDSALADPAGTTAKGRSARDAVKRQLSWDRSAVQLTDIYRSLLTNTK